MTVTERTPIVRTADGAVSAPFSPGEAIKTLITEMRLQQVTARAWNGAVDVRDERLEHPCGLQTELLDRLEPDEPCSDDDRSSTGAGDFEKGGDGIDVVDRAEGAHRNAVPGKRAARSGDQTQRSRKAPDSTCGTQAELSAMLSICPPSSEVTPSVVPRKGTCVISRPRRAQMSSIAMWLLVPMPLVE